MARLRWVVRALSPQMQEDICLTQCIFGLLMELQRLCQTGLTTVRNNPEIVTLPFRLTLTEHFDDIRKAAGRKA